MSTEGLKRWLAEMFENGEAERAVDRPAPPVAALPPEPPPVAAAPYRTPPPEVQETTEGERLDALREEMTEISGKCQMHMRGMSFEGAFYYPVAWLDMHTIRTQAPFENVPAGSRMFATPIVPPQCYICPRAWTIEIWDAIDPTLKRNAMMIGAVVNRKEQFPFDAHQRFGVPLEGIDVADLRTVVKHGFPCAPACQIAVFGMACLGLDLTVTIANTSGFAISGRVTVWGEECVPSR